MELNWLTILIVIITVIVVVILLVIRNQSDRKDLLQKLMDTDSLRPPDPDTEVNTEG
jgi:preprotein translocase subunit YajC